jgi:nitric oxide synthase oxygenase domain/subunit
VFQYFDVRDIRQIRNSERFAREIAPHFPKGSILAVDNNGKDLKVIGVFHPRDDGKTGIYTFATEGELEGHFFRSQMTF